MYQAAAQGGFSERLMVLLLDKPVSSDCLKSLIKLALKHHNKHTAAMLQSWRSWQAIDNKMKLEKIIE
jgi:hypothetical protein